LRPRLLSLLLLEAMGLLACSEGASDPQTALVKRGEQVYLNNCTACHSRNPREAGPVGPPLAGSPLELLQAKVLRNEYPPGYTPKRETKAMIALPHLEPELPAIAAFLAKAAAQE
jgi:mono/diheme cytochrome c family protein